MTILVIETSESGDRTGGDQESEVRSYKASVDAGESEDEVEGAILAEAPEEVRALISNNILPRTRMTLKYRRGVWYSTIEYGSNQRPNENDYTENWETGGGTVKMKQALEHIADYAPTGTAPNFQGAIGVTADGAEGVDIPTPKLDWTETHRLFDGVVSRAYRRMVAGLTPCMNNGEFRGFEAGEVQFLGASASKRGSELWEIAYKFSASQNAADLEIGGMTITEKLGWDYLWFRFGPDVDQNTLIHKPLSAHVERVIPFADFSQFQIGTA